MNLDKFDLMPLEATESIIQPIFEKDFSTYSVSEFSLFAILIVLIVIFLFWLLKLRK